MENIEQEYWDALEKWGRWCESIVGYRDEAAIEKIKMEEFEAEAIVNGGHGEIAIDGKNAETRAAQLLLALKSHAAYQSHARAYRDIMAVLAGSEATRDELAEKMRYCRAILALRTAEANERAYAYGGGK